MSSPFTSQQSSLEMQSSHTCEKCGYTYDFFDVCECPDSRPTIAGKKAKATTFDSLEKEVESSEDIKIMEKPVEVTNSLKLF